VNHSEGSKSRLADLAAFSGATTLSIITVQQNNTQHNGLNCRKNDTQNFVLLTAAFLLLFLVSDFKNYILSGIMLIEIMVSVITLGEVM
jgi:hypothetical protein